MRTKDCVEYCDVGKYCNTPSLRMVLATRDLATRKWFEEAVDGLVSSSMIGKRPQRLVFEVYYTGGEDDANNPKLICHFLQNSMTQRKLPTQTFSSDLTMEQRAPQTLMRMRKTRIEVAWRSPCETFRRGLTCPDVIRQECAGEASPMGVFVGDLLSMHHDVANAVAGEQLRDMEKDFNLHMEHFSRA